MIGSRRRGLVVALGVVALAACNWAQAPREPAIPTAPPGPMPPPVADFEGRFTLTFNADSSCVALPTPFQTRTYSADIAQDRVGRYKGDLSGVEFFPNYETFTVRALFVGGRFSMHSVYAVDRWGDDMPVVERLPADGYLAISGVADVPIRKSDASASAPFNGTFSYCARSTRAISPDYPPSCVQPIDCQSSAHRLTITRQ